MGPVISDDHKIVWVGRDLNVTKSNSPAKNRGHAQLGQVAQSPDQPGSEILQTVKEMMRRASRWIAAPVPSASCVPNSSLSGTGSPALSFSSTVICLQPKPCLICCVLFLLSEVLRIIKAWNSWLFPQLAKQTMSNRPRVQGHFSDFYQNCSSKWSSK